MATLKVEKVESCPHGTAMVQARYFPGYRRPQVATGHVHHPRVLRWIQQDVTEIDVDVKNKRVGFVAPSYWYMEEPLPADLMRSYRLCPVVHRLLVEAMEDVILIVTMKRPRTRRERLSITLSWSLFFQERVLRE